MKRPQKEQKKKNNTKNNESCDRPREKKINEKNGIIQTETLSKLIEIGVQLNC